ncbi:MAG TPA: hypothetical protein VF796_27805, partial [Humisphaera sp.]
MTNITSKPSGILGAPTAPAAAPRRSRVRTWIVRILLLAVLGVVVFVGYGLWVMHKTGVRPSWYRNPLTPAARAAAEKSGYTKLSGLQTWVQESRQFDASHAREPVPTDPTTAPSSTHTLTLTEDELNVMLAPQEKMLLTRYGQWIDEPYLRLHGGRLILAVTLKDTGRVLSVYVEPKLTDDGFMLSIDRLELGEQNVFKFLWTGYVGKLGEQCRPKLDEVRKTAGWIERRLPDGTRLAGPDMGNEAAVASAMNRLVLRSIEGQPADPVLFLPVDGKFEHGGFPMRVTEVKVNDGNLSLTFKPLTPAERDHLMARLKAVYGKEPPPSLAPGKPAGADKAAKG